MIIRILRLTLLACTIVLTVASCATNLQGSALPEDGTEEELLLSRPHLDKAVPRPLGRVLIQWSVIDGASGYLLEMSRYDDFSIIEKSWTIRGNSLEVPLEKNEVLWFRIRTFNSETSSRWSPVLEVRGG